MVFVLEMCLGGYIFAENDQKRVAEGVYDFAKARIAAKGLCLKTEGVCLLCCCSWRVKFGVVLQM